MLRYDFESSIGYWITYTAHAYQQRLNEELTPYGITFRQFQVLAWLVYEGELSPGQLAERMMVERPTLIGILDRMQREGWITRRGDEIDKRKKIIVLEPGAKQVWRKIIACLTRIRSQATQGMSPADIDHLKRLLRQVQINLGQITNRSSNGRVHEVEVPRS